MPNSSFLFLQGHATPFYRALGAGLSAQGSDVRKINFCGGDRLFWGDWSATDWPDGVTGLEEMLRDEIARHSVSTVLLYGDCRPIHRIALAAAKAAGVRAMVFEEGYRRPHWITLERNGVNGYSRLPDAPEWYRERAAALGASPSAQEVGSGIRQRIVFDFQWQLANYRYWWRYPRYRVHRPYPIWAEYSTWCTRLATLKWRQAQSRRLVQEWIGGNRRYFLFPLQLDSDTQVRHHSPFGGIMSAIEAVMQNFARHAPADTHLLIKNHPLDNAWINYRRGIRRQAKRLGLGGRVAFIEGGDAGALIDRASGIVVLNSTIGLTALSAGRPVICLAPSVFDMAGLTAQQTLSDFWRDPPMPDLRLFDDYLRVLTTSCLVNGNFYTEHGIESAVAGSIARLTAEQDPLDEAPARRRTLADYAGRATA